MIQITLTEKEYKTLLDALDDAIDYCTQENELDYSDGWKEQRSLYEDLEKLIDGRLEK